MTPPCSARTSRATATQPSRWGSNRVRCSTRGSRGRSATRSLVHGCVRSGTGSTGTACGAPKARYARRSMARGAAQARRKRTKADARRRRRRMQADAPVQMASQTMFFPRLRRQAKWVFVFLALVFTLGFVVFGVGSGGGIGLGDLFNNNGNTQSSVSESGARDRIAKNPNDAEAYRNLATALQTKGDINGAVAALEKYTKLRPRSIEGQTTLAGLYSSLAAKVQPQLQAIQTGDSALLPAFNSGVQVG